MTNNWEHLRQECLSCKACRLSDTRTQVVFGTGPATAEILLVGEAPGRQEDEQGKPFVGRSGQLLDVFLAGIGLAREKNVFIANIVKCRPPENRDPSPQEREACLPWLRHQFRAIRPKIVVCLGRIAAQVIIRPDFAIMKEHGTWTLKSGVWFTATPHPAALLRNPTQKPLALDDFVQIRKKMDEVCQTTQVV